MNVTEIVRTYLIENGFDGLYDPNSSEGCGCKIDDLFPCGELYEKCVPGHLVKCDDGKLDCIGDNGGEF